MLERSSCACWSVSCHICPSARPQIQTHDFLLSVTSMAFPWRASKLNPSVWMFYVLGKLSNSFWIIKKANSTLHTQYFVYLVLSVALLEEISLWKMKNNVISKSFSFVSWRSSWCSSLKRSLIYGARECSRSDKSYCSPSIITVICKQEYTDILN